MAKPPPKYPHIRNPSTRIYWDDLHDEAGLKIVSLAARGLWTFHMLAIMAGAGGYLALEGKALSVEALAALVGKPFEEVNAAYQELSTWDVFSVDRFGTPYNRRMLKAQKKAKTSAKNGQKGGRPKSLETQGDLDLKTYSEPTANLRPNLNDGPRARGSQDSSMNQIYPESSEKNPASANGLANGNGKHRPALQPGAVMKRIIRTLELSETQDTKRYALALQDEMTPGELQELHDPDTNISRVTAILSHARSIHDGR